MATITTQIPANGKTLTTVPKVQCYRLVYDSATKKVLHLFNSAGITRTVNSVFASNTIGKDQATAVAALAECLNQITTLGLDYTPPQNM